MKQISIITFFLTIILAIVSCCKNDDSEANNIGISDLSVTGCKSKGATRTQDFASDIEESVSWEIDHSYLWINHTNIMFNCEPGEIKTDIKIDGNEIWINEYCTGMEANCFCPYDMSYKVGPLDKGTYQLVLCNGFTSEQKRITVQL